MSRPPRGRHRSMRWGRLSLRRSGTAEPFEDAQGLDVGQGPGQILLRVRLDGQNGGKFPLLQDGKEPCEGEGSLPDGQVLVEGTLVVVEVDLDEPVTEPVDPGLET